MAALRLSKPSTQQGVSTAFGPSLQLSGGTSKNGNVPTNNSAVGGPSRRLTQDDQDRADLAKEQEATQNLVETWLQRLQLISVIATFFASTESGLLGKVLPTPDEVLSTAGQIANVSFMCALVVHAFAAVISFLGAFFLVQYKLLVAEHDEDEAKQEMGMVDSPTSISGDPEKSVSPTSVHASGMRTDRGRASGRVRVNPGFPENQTIWSTNPRLVQVGPFNQVPPTELLARCNSLCVFLTFLGFLFAIMGLISFAWDRLPQSIGISASVAMGFCLITGALILIVPSTKKSHIFL